MEEKERQQVRAAGLRYVTDGEPGFRRKRVGRGFAYYDQHGRLIADEKTRRRIKSLAIPPAYHDVWICPYENGHLQATGRDVRNRKQYRYHPEWRASRDEAKYHQAVAFARALPRIRRQVRQDMSRPGLGREKILATLVHLLETTLIRVGNDEYAVANRSFGLTTLESRHLDLNGSRVAFEFRGKGGKQHRISLSDRRVARILRRCQDLPGQELFQYIDEEGERHSIDSRDVNDYLRAAAGADFSAKDFRTWAGTVLAAWALSELETSESDAAARRNVVEAVQRVAARLGNTPAICRKCYIHPEVLESYLDGTLVRSLKQRAKGEIEPGREAFSAAEDAVLGLLQKRLSQNSA